MNPTQKKQNPKQTKQKQRCISVSRLSDLRAAIEGGSAIGKVTTAAAATATLLPPPPPPPLLPSLDGYDVVAIDEAQFFDDLVPFATALADGCSNSAEKEEEKEEEEEEERKRDSSPSSSSPPPPLPPRPRAFTVLVAGLDGDSERGVFGGLLQLVPHAERVTRLAARCSFCGEDAHFSVRLSNSSSTSSSPSEPGAARVPAPTLLQNASSSSSSSSSSSPQQVQVGGAESYAPACRRHYLQHSSSSSSRNSSKVLTERRK